MIISDNPKPTLSAFQNLMKKTDELLNADAQRREDYYVERKGKLLESDVFDAIKESARGTAFDGSIRLVSGSSFPDIVVNKYYGVEVKSTEKNHWTTIGGSILESTRNVNVERIFLTFGKLGKPVRFISRPYEECLSGIAVTHYPRYQIDMNLPKGQTIFDKMGLTYDELRKKDNPVAPVSNYYKAQLKEGEKLWWASDDAEAAAPATVKIWCALSEAEKCDLIAKGFALFPEVLGGDNLVKYNAYALWLVTQLGIVNTCVRDSFSAGGQKDIVLSDGTKMKVPAAFGRIIKHGESIAETIKNETEDALKEYWRVDAIETNRMAQWCDIVANHASAMIGYQDALKIVTDIFAEYLK